MHGPCKARVDIDPGYICLSHWVTKLMLVMQIPYSTVMNSELIVVLIWKAPNFEPAIYGELWV